MHSKLHVYIHVTACNKSMLHCPYCTCRYFPFELSYWFDWVPYFTRQTQQLQVRVQSDGIQADEDDVIGSGNDITEGTALLRDNRVSER